MTVKSAQTIAGLFVARNDATGALTAATGTPVGALYVAGVANAAVVTVTGSNPYKWSVTLPTLTAGQLCQMYVTATVSSVNKGEVVWTDVADTVLNSDIVCTVAVSSAAASAAASGQISCQTHYTMSGSVTSTTTSDLSAATLVWLAVKNADSDDDDDSLIFLEATEGLVYIDGAAAVTAANGTLAVTGSSGDWTVTYWLDEEETAKLEDYIGDAKPAAIKALVSDDTVAVWDGDCAFSRGVVKTYA